MNTRFISLLEPFNEYSVNKVESDFLTAVEFAEEPI